MKILITGASGFLGTALTRYFERNNYTVFALSRKTAGKGTIYWNPEDARIDISSLEGFDGVIHLAGENLVGMWTSSKKQRIYYSRIHSTRFLSETLLQLNRPPRVFISASAVGIYGNRGDEVLTENSESGNGFLARLCRDWEQAALLAKRPEMRLCQMRLGLILSTDGGFLKKILPLFRLGLSGRLGDGQQFMSWIHLQDFCRAVEFILLHENISGAVNITAPEPVRNKTFTKTLGKILHRPTLIAAPAWLLKIAFGQMAEEMLLASTRVMPQRLQQAEFNFDYGLLEEALKNLL